ncbi:MAG TPA: zf-HC2 domain-containing protein [Streptosporangiaceae bacterium]|nr:zf-HC2 domain-containing protein [Streptosporangiaceae bacterium]
MSELNEMGCTEFADAAAELALGVLTGRERARAIAHLDRCDACRGNVRQLTMTGEELLGLLPASEPPAGFETRVMGRLGLGAPGAGVAGRTGLAGRARRLGRGISGWPGHGGASRSRRMLAAAAVAAAVIVAGLGGWGLRAATSSPPASPLSSAALLSAARHTVGRIYLYDGGSRWLYMSVDMDSGNGTVTCQVRDADGHFTTVGSFRVHGGYGSWGGPAPAGGGSLTGARLVSADGTVLATAGFPAA